MESEILKFICANQGAVDTDFLMYNLTGDSVNDVISTGDNFVLCCPFGQPKVVARSSLKLCRNRDCLASCRELHLCKKFLLTGSCPFTHSRRGCRFSHELDSDHNVEVLRAHGLESLSRAELCTLLLQSDASLLPQVCHDYNNGGGEVGLCQDGYACKRLHICERFLNRECSCSKAHDFSALQPSKSLQERGIPEDLFPSLKSIYANILALKYADRKGDGGRGRGAFRGNNRGGNRGNRGNRGSRSNSQQRQQFSSDGLRGWTSFSDLFSADNDEESSEPNPFSHQTRPAADVAGADGPNRKQRPVRDKTEICMYFIKGHCRHSDERCFKVHDKMPYRWEVEEGDRWTALADNEEIEKDYCDPKNAYSRSSPQVHFDTMTCGSKKVRRLSTANSLLEPTFIHTTEWVWFWEDEFGKWNTYAAAANGRSASDVDSDKLEQKFLENDKDVVDFTAGSQSYSLSFQDMMQTNKQYGTKKPVKRRPRFVSAADVKTKRVRRPPGQANFTAVPDHWDKTQTPQPGFKRLPLLRSSEEFKKIESLFCETMRGFDLVRIERIQNKSLWEVFQWQKNEMKTKNKGRNVTEKQLFHGTDSKYVDVICHTNFDWRVCGVNGTAFGQGSYFARDAKYSHSYTGDADVRSMFVSRVLVGDFTKGESSYRRPPSKDGGDINLFDSCVNDVHDPSIFVVFEKHQIYPEYLLQYKTTHPLIALYGAARPAPAPAPAPAPRPAPAPAPRPAPAPAPAPRPAPQPVRPAVQPSRSLSQPSASVYSYSSASYQPSRTFKPAMLPPPPKKNDSCVIA